MIQRDLILTVNNNTASLNEPLVIYQHDRGLTLRIKVMKYKFVFNKIMEEDLVADTSIISARAIVLKPDGRRLFECPRQAVEDDCVIIHITLDWTDELLEIGKYKLQLQLYGSDYINERVTLPPFEFTVAKPIGYVQEEGLELIAYADSTVTDISVLSDEQSGVEVEDGDLAVGVYDKTEWEPGDIVTSDDLNKFEDAVEYLVRTQQAKAIYTPHVDDFGNLSWTNDLALDNPSTVNIQGPRGLKGDKGDQGIQGPKGQDGTVSFDELTDEQIEMIKGPAGPTGPAGEPGPAGPVGPKGADGTMSFTDLTEEQRESLRGPAGPKGPKGDPLTYLDLTQAQKEDLTRDFVTCSNRIKRIEIVEEYPDPEKEELGVLYIKVSDI